LHFKSLDTRPAQTYGPARVCALLCALLGTLFSTVNVAQGQMIDPSDLWFRAFLLLKEGEGLEQNDSLGALNKYVESKRMLDGLASDHPNFHEEIVRFRRQELAQKIPALRQLLAQGITKGVPNRGSGATPMPQLSQTTGDVALRAPQQQHLQTMARPPPLRAGSIHTP